MELFSIRIQRTFQLVSTNLTGLQKDANRYHNLTAIRVQEITQSLYEKN